MQELINRLTEKVGLTAEQASKSIDTIKEFVKEKFPMLGGAVDNMFAPETGAATNAPSAPANETLKPEEHSIMDKISDVIPGQAGEKVENFVKNAEHKVEEVFGNLKDKIDGLMGGHKN